MSLFIEEIIKTYNQGKIQSTFSPIRVRDIVFTSLANSRRFNGITHKPYSTMIHSYAVGQLASDFALIFYNYDSQEREWVELFGYMHDMGETIVGDIVYPLKTGEYEAKAKEFAKIEKEFLYWLGSEIFEISDFKKKYDKYYPIVERADTYLGTLELLGISKDGDFKSATLFCDMKLFDNPITPFGFEYKFNGLLAKLKG